MSAFRRVMLGSLSIGFVLGACTEDPGTLQGTAGNPALGSSGVGGATAGAVSASGSGGSAGFAAASGASGAGSGGAAGSNPGRSGGAGAAGSAGASGGGAGAGAAGASGNAGSGGAGSGGAGNGGAPAELEPFSFFVTSIVAMRRLSGSEDGFGGDFRYGEADGLSGADKICTEIAEESMAGAGQKGWRAFLSVAEGADGEPVHAIDRVGDGPWYDRLGRLVAMNKQALANTRPQGADAAIVNDLPNEDGVPNHRPDPNQPEVDNHHILTGSDTSGRLYNNSVNGTCDNWTSTAQSSGRPRIGFSWPAGSRQHWISGQDEGGCGAGFVLGGMGGSDPSNPIVGSGGGYGGIYCFALSP